MGRERGEGADRQVRTGTVHAARGRSPLDTRRESLQTPQPDKSEPGMRPTGGLSSSTFRYRAYGLSIRSDTAFPELTPVPSPAETPDIQVRLRAIGGCEEPTHWFNSSKLDDGRAWLSCARIGGGYLLRYAGLADFVVDGCGREIACSRIERGTSSFTIRHLLLDQTLPLVLNLRGREAIHATAVVTPHGACAFVGPAGAGKSTLAASFLFAGYPVLGDDCLVLEETDQILATPAYPGLRLWKDAFEALAARSVLPIPVADYTDKARLLGPQLFSEFPSKPHPLARIYLVERADSSEKDLTAGRVEETSAREAFVALVSSAFPLDITDRSMLARQFRFFERLLAKVPVRRLRVPNGFDGLPLVREATLSDLGSG